MLITDLNSCSIGYIFSFRYGGLQYRFIKKEKNKFYYKTLNSVKIYSTKSNKTIYLF
jgi:hypothetical protein